MKTSCLLAENLNEILLSSTPKKATTKLLTQEKSLDCKFKIQQRASHHEGMDFLVVRVILLIQILLIIGTVPENIDTPHTEGIGISWGWDL